MSLADEFTTLSTLANELDQKSVAHLLRSALDANILPVVPLQPDWHVFLVCFMGLRSPNQLIPGLTYKRSASYVQGVECLELDKLTCSQLLQDDYVTIRTIGAVYVASTDSTDLSRRTAKRFDIPKPFLDIGAGKRPILKPCFAVFHEGKTDLSVIQSRQTVEDFKGQPGVRVHRNALRLLPSDETKLRARFTQRVPAPEPIDTSGSHISEKFRQLLEVFNEHRQLLQDTRKLGNSNAARENAVELLRQSLWKIDRVVWKSDTMLRHAIQLIFPSLPSDRRSKKRSPYRADGMPTMLAALLAKLESDHSKLLDYETHEYEHWLKNKLSMHQTQAKYITTIVRLAHSPRGGQRPPKSPEH